MSQTKHQELLSRTCEYQRKRDFHNAEFSLNIQELLKFQNIVLFVPYLSSLELVVFEVVPRKRRERPTSILLAEITRLPGLDFAISR